MAVYQVDLREWHAWLEILKKRRAMHELKRLCWAWDVPFDGGSDSLYDEHNERWDDEDASTSFSTR